MSLTGRTLTIVGSVALHAAVGLGLALAAPAPQLAKPPLIHCGLASVPSILSVLGRPVIARAEREQLVAKAMADRALGKLELGAFLLAANAIDAAEEGAPFDRASATQLYAARLALLRGALEHDPPGRAVPKVFGDLRYAGLPGGRLGDALMLGSGSCEPLSQLIAATLYDGGLRDKSHLRYYGGVSAGASHLAPVIRSAQVEWDLIAGARSTPGGRDFAASGLIEAYARAHALSAVPAKDHAAGPEASSDDGDAGLFGDTRKTMTMTAGYPPNDDRFDGALPLYAERAVADPPSRTEPAARATDEGLEDNTARNCSVLLRLAELDPPRATILSEAPGEPIEVTLHHLPSRSELERTATLVAELERTRARSEKQPIEKLIVLGCLVGLYDRASLEFSFAREPLVASRAVLEARRARRQGADLIRKGTLASEAGAQGRQKLLHDYSMGAWVLVQFDGGPEVVEKLAREATDDSFVAINLTAALIVHPSSRERGVALAAGLSLDSQIAVMQELAHAHDNARPWSGTYDPDPSTFGSSDAARKFAQSYAVLRPVAWRLWEVPRPPSETISALLLAAKEKNLDLKTTRAIVAYYVQNELWLHARRDDAGPVLAEIDASLRAHGFGPLLAFDDVKPFPGDAKTIRAALDAYASQGSHAL